MLFGETQYLREGEQSSKDGVIAKKKIVEVYFSCLVLADEVSIAIIDGVESKASEIHSNEIEVHAFDTA